MTSVCIVIPAHNESVVLKENMSRLVLFCRDALASYHWHVVIAENNSSDGTFEIAQDLEDVFPGEVVARELPVKGKGAAVRRVWIDTDADVVVFMDADLSTGLESLPLLILHGQNGLAVGSRYARGASAKRSFFRLLGSRVYCWIARVLLGVRLSDFQCGFKAMDKKAAEQVVPKLASDRWFFDTELVAWSANQGVSITEIPVNWIEDQNTGRKSTLPAGRTFISFIRELFSLRKRIKAEKSARRKAARVL